MVVLNLGISQKDGSYDIDWVAKMWISDNFLTYIPIEGNGGECWIYSLFREPWLGKEFWKRSTFQFKHTTYDVVEKCLDANVEAPTSSFVHGARTKKKNNTSKKIDKRCKQKTLTWWILIYIFHKIVYLSVLSRSKNGLMDYGVI